MTCAHYKGIGHAILSRNGNVNKIQQTKPKAVELVKGMTQLSGLQSTDSIDLLSILKLTIVICRVADFKASLID